MSKDFQERNPIEDEAIKNWIGGRIDTIHRTVSAHDVLQRNGVTLRYGSSREEQISCPFHGQDVKPSARVFPESAKGPSGVWCYVCQEQWDAIRLWKKFTNFDGKFTALLREIEQAYHIEVPESPREYQGKAAPDTSDADEIFELIEVCDRRLKSSRSALGMEGSYRVLVALDRVRYQFDHKKMGTAQAKVILESILEKIEVKVRSCLEG